MLALVIGIAVGAGAIWLIRSDHESGDPPTTPSEAGSVKDLASSVTDQYALALDMTDFCEKHWRGYGATRLDGYDACFQKEVKPIQESANDAARQSIGDLKADVGPECLRALRRVELTFAPNDLELPDDALNRAARVCQNESKT